MDGWGHGAVEMIHGRPVPRARVSLSQGCGSFQPPTPRGAMMMRCGLGLVFLGPLFAIQLAPALRRDGGVQLAGVLFAVVGGGRTVHHAFQRAPAKRNAGLVRQPGSGVERREHQLQESAACADVAVGAVCQSRFV
jgi:hypothetical protein